MSCINYAKAKNGALKKNLKSNIMKRTSRILTWFGALLLSCLFGTRALAQMLPSGLTYKRLWTDSIRFMWNAPELAAQSAAKSAWTELPLEHTVTHHLVGIAQGTNTYPVTDGQYIYVNVWSKDAPSQFFKYNVDGTYIEYFTIEGLERSLRDLTYDGQYFYGGFEGLNSIAVLDLAEKKLVKTIAVDRSVRHISYIPMLDESRGGFEVGDINSSCFIDKSGKVLKDSALAFHLPDDEFTNAPDMEVYGTAYHKGKIYAHCYLGIMVDMTVKPIDYRGPYSAIVEYDVETGLATGRRFNLANRQEALELQNYMAATGLHILETPKGTFNLLLGFGMTGQNQPPLVMLKLESAPLPANLSGYNLYADGVKVNAALIDKSANTYHVGGLPQGQAVHYELKAVYGSTESAAAALTVNLPDSRLLPFYEDFNSLSFNTNYWTIDNPDAKAARPWSVRSVASSIPGVANRDLLAYQGALDQPDADNGKTAHSMKLVSKVMNFKNNAKVLLRFQTAQNVPFLRPQFCDTLFLEINTGNGWQVVWQDTTVGNGKSLAYEALDITAQAAGKSDVRFRFRVDGNSFEKSFNGDGFLYYFYIDNFRIWEPVYVQAAGSVSFNGAPVADVAVRLADGEEALIYETTTDAQGNFTIADMQTGTYRLSAFRADYNLYEAMVEITPENHTMAVSLSQPAFETTTEVLELTMRPGETLRSGFALGNSGTGDMNWRARFDFPEAKVAKVGVESGMAEFPVLEAWQARGNVETQYAYLNDTIYSFYQNNTLKAFELLKTLPDGTAVETGTVLPFATNQFPRPTCLFADDTYLYFGKGPKFYRYDVSSGQITDSVETILSSITYAAWHPVSRTFLVGNNQSMMEYDAAGTALKEYAITGLNPKYIAVDVYSYEKPVLWMACNNKRPEGAAQGEYVGLYGYSLDTAALTGRYFVANRHPEYVAPVYNNRQTTEISGLFSTDQLVPGRFTLFVTTSMKANGQPVSVPNLCAVYDVAQSVKWIGMETYKGALAAGETSNFYLNFNTEDLKHGDKRNCTVTLSANIAIEPYVFPVRLTVDSTYENPCAMPTGLSHSVSGAQVDLNWRMETAGGALVTENIEGYLVRRNGIILTDELLKEASFRDMDPIMGVNVYEVQAFYKFPTYECNSSWSAPDTVRVVYEGECAAATGLKASIDKQRYVTLTWDYPQNDMPAGGVAESFETMKAFSTEEALGNGWTTLDLDRSLTYGLNGAQFPHQGEALPFIVFNPYETTPAISDRVGAYTGRQMVASVSSRLDGVTNNDWLISPELDAEQPSMVLNFMAKTAFLNYGYEELRVAYSTTGKNVEDFVFFEEKPINVPGEWTEYNYKLPKGTKYVALNCVSKNKFMLIIDDIYVGPMRSHMRLENYAVYKNGELAMEITPRAVGFFDYALQDGSYIYEVAARYNNGCVSAKSEPITVDIAFKHGITPPRALSATINKENESVDLNWKEPAWGEAEEFSYHNGMQYGFALSDPDGAPAMFSVGMAITMNDPTLLDYSLSALRIGFFDACDAEAFIIDMTTGQYVARQVIPHVYEAGFITVGFDHPVKVEYGKSYLVGYELLKYYPGGFPAGTDDGPVVSGGDFISFNGIEWGTVNQVYGDNFNWTIDAILEVVEKPEMTAGKAEVAADTDALRKAVFATGRLDGAANRTISRQKAGKPVFYRPIAPLNPKSGEPEVAVSGYIVSRGGEPFTTEPQSAMTYSDKAVEHGKTYRYQVTAVYANGEKASSDFLQVVYMNDLSAEETLEVGFDVYTAGKTVFVENRLGDACDILIRNLSGQTVAARYGNADARVEFPMADAPHGLYLVCIYYKDKLLVKKIVL